MYTVHYFAYIYLVIFVSIVHEVLAFITVLDQGIIPLDRESIGIQFFIDIENSHHLDACRVISKPKMCYLADKEHKYCFLDTVHGDNVEVIRPKNRQTLIHVYPTLYQYDQVGYCDFIIDYKCSNIRRSKQLDIHIPFDTQLAHKEKKQHLKAYANLQGSECDSLDEDSLRECEPVNCDLKYSGRKPFYEGSHSECVNAPICVTDDIKTFPDIVYVPKINICRDLDQPITVSDIYAINTGLGVVTVPTQTTVNDFKILLKSNCSTISENLKMLRDMMYGKLSAFNGDTSDYKACCEDAILSIFLYIIAICGLLLSLVCCLQTTVWCYLKCTSGQLKNTFVNWKSSNKNKKKDFKQKPSRLNRDVTDNLLKEVIVRDLPIEMRLSMVDLCQRIDKEIKRKKRYRMVDLGNQVNLRQSKSAGTSETSSEIFRPDDDDKAELTK